MKNLLISLLVLFPLFSAAASIKTLTPKEATSLFIQNISRLKPSNQNPYETYNKSILSLFSESLLSSHDSPTTTTSACSLVNKKEICVISIFHAENAEESEELGYGSEWSVQFVFEVERTGQLLRIKDNLVDVQLAG